MTMTDTTAAAAADKDFNDPLLGSNFVPLAGATVDPPATAHDGRDFVFMQLGS